MTVDANSLNSPASRPSVNIAVANSTVVSFTTYCVTQDLVNKAVISALNLVDQARDKSEGLKLVLQGLVKFGCDKPTLDLGHRISKIIDSCLVEINEKSINQIAGKIPFCASSACALEVFKNFNRTVSAESKQRIFFYDLIEGSFSGCFVGLSTGLGASMLSNGSQGSHVVTAVTGGLLGSIGGIIGVIAGKTLGSLHLKMFTPKSTAVGQ